MTKEEKMIRIIEETRPERYSMSLAEMTALVNEYNKDLYMCIWATFRYGFVKGQRSIKNQQKKAGAANV